MTKYSSTLLFYQCQIAPLKSILLTIAFFLGFHLCKICFAIAGCANRTCQAYCVMRLQERMALGVNIPPDVAQTVKTCFLDRGHKFPGPPVVARCALSPHLKHDLTGTEKGEWR